MKSIYSSSKITCRKTYDSEVFRYDSEVFVLQNLDVVRF